MTHTHGCNPTLLTTDDTWMAHVGNDKAFAGSIWTASDSSGERTRVPIDADKIKAVSCIVLPDVLDGVGKAFREVARAGREKVRRGR